jgi:hypothetical protein
MVDTFSVRQKPHLAEVLAGWECGKTEEGSGKKGSEFLNGKSRMARRLSISFVLYFGGISCLRRMGSKLAGPFSGGVHTDQLHNIAAHTIRNYVRRSQDG